jgi:hypothetical protein
MKRSKGLTIFFFSVMVLVATPRAMQHFQNYVAAAQNRAQVELLELLLSYGVPEAESTTTPQQAAPQTLASGVTKDKEPQAETFKPRSNATDNKALSAAPALKSGKRTNRNFEFSFVDFSNESVLAFEPLLSSVEAQGELIARTAPVAARQVRHGAEAAQAKAIKSLLRTVKRGDRKAIRALETELSALVKANPHLTGVQAPFVRVKMERDIKSPPATEREPAAPAGECRPPYAEAEDSMR